MSIVEPSSIENPLSDDTATNSSQASLQYEDSQGFNAYLDDVNSNVIIEATSLGKVAYLPSQVLYCVDRQAYQAALIAYQGMDSQAFKKLEMEHFKEVIFNQFPAPIAYPFHRLEKSSHNFHQRLGILKDIWEALIFLLYALVVGEYRCSNLPMIGINSIERFFDEKLHNKLELIKKLLEIAANNHYPLLCSNLVSIDLIDELIKLNKKRNEFAHSTTDSVAQARSKIDERYPEVLDVLNKMKELRSIRLMHYVGNEDDLSKVRCEVFMGHSSNVSIEVISLSPTQILTYLPHLNSKTLLAKFEDHIFSISPFFHFFEGAGNMTKLCFYKLKDDKRDDKRLVWRFEILGESREEDFDPAEFETIINELKRLLRDRSGGIPKLLGSKGGTKS